MVARRGLWGWGVAAPAPGHRSGSPVLVADDDADIRIMLRTLFELDGFEVIEAEDGDVAWRIIQQQQPPVVVADVQMPGLNGLQICRMVRQTRRPCKVIVYTAGMATEQEAREAGCDRYFLKTDPCHACGTPPGASSQTAQPRNGPNTGRIRTAQDGPRPPVIPLGSSGCLSSSIFPSSGSRSALSSS